MRTKALRHQWPDLRRIGYRVSVISEITGSNRAQADHSQHHGRTLEQKINRPTPMASALNRSNPNP